MAIKRCLFRCYNCNLDTELTLEASEKTTIDSNQLIEKKTYCKYCNHLNLIKIPNTWDPRPLVLGDDDFLGYNKGIPVLQGKRE